VTALGDWTNAGRVSADVTIEEVIAPLPTWEFKGDIAEGEQKSHTVTIPPGIPEVTFRLSWSDDWGAYPTNDLDMLLFGPGGVTNFTGTTLNSPETVTIQNPAAVLDDRCERICGVRERRHLRDSRRILNFTEEADDSAKGRATSAALRVFRGGSAGVWHK
jgi:hypothetical protein